jgi:hypothetical protein
MNPVTSTTSPPYQPAGTVHRAVSGERAPANHLPAPHQTADMPPAALPRRSRVPTRRRVERIAGRYAPPPPQSARNVRARRPRSRKSLVVNRKIKAQPAAHPSP